MNGSTGELRQNGTHILSEVVGGAVVNESDDVYGLYDQRDGLQDAALHKGRILTQERYAVRPAAVAA